MLAFSVLVMAATLVTLLLQPSTPLLSVLQDMDMYPSPSAPRYPPHCLIIISALHRLSSPPTAQGR
jgi:hypothetical protein